MDELSIEQRVAKGAAFLDGRYPGWERRINLGTLNLALGDYDESTEGGCIVCQVTRGEFWRGASRLDVPSVIGYGFCATPLGEVDAPQQYAALDEAWISLIKERFDTGNLSDLP